ncbi:MAG: hypothetical protein ACTSYI_14475 [Promethearchaeota archaeon]
MPQQKRKKLSLEEARALFNDKPEKSKRRPHQGRSPRNQRSRPQNYSNQDPARRDKRIAMLERRVMEGNLTTDEEQKILNEIEQLEKSKSAK